MENNRRGFLRGLVSLPLIGGGVALIGNPIAVATMPDERALFAYSEWLDMERRVLNRLLFPDMGILSSRVCPANTGAHTFHQPGSDPSTRAELVLATVGCDWRKDAL